MKINKSNLKIWIPALVGVLLIVLIIPIKPLSFLESVNVAGFGIKLK